MCRCMKGSHRAAAAAAAGLLLVCFAFANLNPVCAETGAPAVSPAPSATAENEYAVYAQKHAGVPAGSTVLSFSGASYAEDAGANVTAQTDKEGAVRWDSEKGSLRYALTVPEAGLYTLRLQYRPLPGRGGDIRIGVRLDGSYPFAQARELSFPRLWQDADKEQTDSLGNEFIPEQTELDRYVQYEAQDMVGVHDGAYVFLLTAGEHVLELLAVSEPFVLADIELVPAEQAKKYADCAWPQAPDYDGEPIVVEGEDTLYKTASSLLPQADTDSALIRPIDPSRMVLNYIGGTGWDSIGQAVTWKINVPADGYYRIGATYRQNTVINGVSYRKLKIDGETPFAEAENWAFPYANSWAYTCLKDEKNAPYRIYLEKGEHELTLDVCMGEMTPFRSRLEELTKVIGDLYVQIHMITGEFPDANRSYELFKQIPQFNETLAFLTEQLQQLADDMESSTGAQNSNLASSLRNMRRVMEIMLDNPYAAHQYKSDYYSNYNTVSSWLHEMTSMPLAIDAIYLQAPDGTGAARKTNFWKSLRYGFLRFLNSFSDDYRYVEGQQGDEHLTLWLSSSFDQVQVVQSLLRDSFEKQNGITVNVKLVNTSLVQGLLSGDFPDCAFGAAHADPVNLAIRGALVDLTQFDDFEEITTRFRTDACLPYYCGDACYALPDSQGFRVQFYRKDIFEALGLTVPETWEEFSEVSSELMRNNMQVGLPYASLAGPEQMSSGIASMSLFPSLLLQYDIPLYNEEKTACVLDDIRVIEVFTEMTDYYTKKGFPLSADFYNQFRAGLMPLSIQSYSMYTILDDMAPDIRGRWGIAPLPGVRKADGSIDRTDAAFGTGAFIVQRSANHEGAWKLLKWWTSEDTQVRYSQGMENRLGVTGRQAVSNVKALSRLSWKTDVLQVLETQGACVGEYPELPGGYYVSRAIDQAFWNVSSDGKRPKDMLFKWNEIANREIARKMKEYAVGQ